MDDVMERYRALINKVVDRKQSLKRLIQFLETRTAWLTAPASDRYHLCREKGLLEHSVGVTETLLKVSRCLLEGVISDESMVIVGLFHDVGKSACNLSTGPEPYYIPNPSAYLSKIRSIPYVTNPNMIAMGTAMRSLYIINKFLSLTDTEAQAIAYHDGGALAGYLSIVRRETPLTLLLHFSDGWHAAMHEENRPIDMSQDYFYGILDPLQK